MKKKLVGMEKSGSWVVCIILFIFGILPGMLYWLIKMRKKKIYKYEEKEK